MCKHSQIRYFLSDTPLNAEPIMVECGGVSKTWVKAIGWCEICGSLMESETTSYPPTTQRQIEKIIIAEEQARVAQ